MPFLPVCQMAIPSRTFAYAIRNWACTVLPISISKNFIASEGRLNGLVLLEVRLEIASDQDALLSSFLTGRGFLASIKLEPSWQKSWTTPRQLLKTRSLFLMPQMSTKAFDDLAELIDVFFGNHPLAKAIRMWSYPVYIEFVNLVNRANSTLERQIFDIDGINLLYPAPLIKSFE